MSKKQHQEESVQGAASGSRGEKTGLQLLNLEAGGRNLSEAPRGAGTVTFLLARVSDHGV